MREFPVLSITSEWVERTLARLTLDQKIGQLLHPCLKPSATEDERTEALGDVEPGGMFLFSGSREEFKNTTQWLQEHSPVPLIISSDLENGAGRMILDATTFPHTMSLGATDDEHLAYETGRAAAVEGRAFGVHWAFAPVVDVNINPFNPGTNTISFGDDVDLVARLSKAVIRGMQENGICATAKHFPGGGLDDRDQHICNTINPLRTDQWLALSGRTFQEAIDLGVWSIMTGHISLPAWDPGNGTHIQNAPPATLSRKILIELLREQMGFQGVVITDAMDMGGVTAFGPHEEIVPAAIEAGCDMILFSSAKRDFDVLKRAVKEGRLSEARIEESARRILALKKVLGLHENLNLPTLAPADSTHFRQISQEIAEKAITLVRDRNEALPLKLEQGTRVLSYHFRGDPSDAHVDSFDDLLHDRGVEIVRLDETDVGKLHKTNGFSEYDAVILSAVFDTSWGTNRIRPAGGYMRDVWALINSHHPRLVLVSYGSPYLIYDAPHLPCVINAYSPDLNTQKAVLQVLTGELDPTGKSPVNLEAPYLFKYLEGLRYAL
ncbi:MAG: glycoside hydrolase family 3 protein [Chloroflexi bacterium]|nr:glycoside hydrolase family 3 protein [Chloroflexota bacterium]